MFFLSTHFSLLQAQLAPKHEMRALWIATVSNIDWPSAPGLSAGAQQRELSAMLDMALQYRLNTIVLQIRPSADAFYRSSLEPWSKWLSGEQGKAPEPGYDPLDFAVSECRKRGLDLHVWLNPYRVMTDTSDQLSADHIASRYPGWIRRYGKMAYFDPGEPGVRDFVASVAGDIVRRYDIDAIHMDDYFYPYRISGVDFPDDSTFARYNPDALGRADWRRENVNKIIRQIHDTIKAVNPWVEFGISPFGVWRNSGTDPAGSNTRAGQTNYDDLYADILLWQKEGWIDYVVPQIYWHIGFSIADYSVLADWWSMNSYGCRLYVGQAPYRIDRKSQTREWRKAGEIVKQVRLNRTMPEIAGSFYFSGKVLRSNPLRLRQKLTRACYRYTALTPVNNRIIPLVAVTPSNAVCRIEGDTARLSWEKAEKARDYVIYRFRKGKAANIEDPSSICLVTGDCSAAIADGTGGSFVYYVTSRSLSRNESTPARFMPQ